MAHIPKGGMGIWLGWPRCRPEKIVANSGFTGTEAYESTYFARHGAA
jgi:hypothetical protein